jgi:hypothetical protein
MATWIDDESSLVSGAKPNGIFSRRRQGRVVTVVLALSVVVALLVAWHLYNRPAHLYAVNPNRTTWASDVKSALSESGSGSPLKPVGPLSFLPGVGKIATIVIDRSPRGQRVSVLFMTSFSGNSGGLAYVRGYPLPPDTCLTQLSGSWWQLVPLSYSTNHCPRGFHFTPGG